MTGMAGEKGLAIRLARDSEAEAVRHLVLDAYGHYVARIGKPPGPMLDDYAQRIAQGQVSVIEEDGRLLGILVLEEEPDAILLDNIAILPAAQGRGLGRALVAHAEAETRRRGRTQLRLYTHVLMVENIGLYARLGFRETGRVSEKGFERVYMVKAV
jgi:ribosomal protein S18 acetylase RimI-like enzyme